MFATSEMYASGERRTPSLNWQRHRQVITHIYRNRGFRVEEVAEYMQRHYGFVASAQQYVEKFLQWRVRQFKYPIRQQPPRSAREYNATESTGLDKCPDLILSQDSTQLHTQSSEDTELSSSDEFGLQHYTQDWQPAWSQFQTERSTCLQNVAKLLLNERQTAKSNAVDIDDLYEPLASAFASAPDSFNAATDSRLSLKERNISAPLLAPCNGSNSDMASTGEAEPDIPSSQNEITAISGHIHYNVSDVINDDDTSQANYSSKETCGSSSDSSQSESLSDEDNFAFLNALCDMETDLFQLLQERFSSLVHDKTIKVLETQSKHSSVSEHGSASYGSNSHSGCGPKAISIITGSAHTQNSSRSTGKQNRKRKRREKDDDDPEKNSANGDREPPEDQASAPKQVTKKLACPYHKSNPQKFQEVPEHKKYKTCPRGFANTKDLSEHLRRVHCGPKFWCKRCSAEFKNEAEVDQHIRQKVPCELFENPNFVEESYLMSAKKAQVLKKKVPAVSVEAHWLRIWSLIFPNLPKPSSIYQEMFDLDALFSQAIDEVVPVFARQRVTELLRTTIDVQEEETYLRRVMLALRDRVWDHYESQSGWNEQRLQFQGFGHPQAQSSTALPWPNEGVIVPSSQEAAETSNVNFGDGATSANESGNSQAVTGMVFGSSEETSKIDSSGGNSDLDFMAFDTNLARSEVYTLDIDENDGFFPPTCSTGGMGRLPPNNYDRSLEDWIFQENVDSDIVRSLGGKRI